MNTILTVLCITLSLALACKSEEKRAEPAVAGKTIDGKVVNNNTKAVAIGPKGLEGTWGSICSPVSNNIWIIGTLTMKDGNSTLLPKYFSDSSCKNPMPKEKITKQMAALKITGTYKVGKLIKDNIYELDTTKAGGKPSFTVVKIEAKKFSASDACTEIKDDCKVLYGHDAAHRSTTKFKPDGVWTRQ